MDNDVRKREETPSSSKVFSSSGLKLALGVSSVSICGKRWRLVDSGFW